MERVLVALFALGVVGASAVPYVVGARATTGDHVWVGTTEASEDDYPTYLVKMRAGARGEWTYRSPYAPDLEHTGTVRPLYALLGAIGGTLGAAPWIVYHAARVVIGALALLVLFGVAGLVTRDRGERWCALVLASLGSGVGAFLERAGARDTWSYDLWVPELNVFHSLLTNPHFPASLILVLAILVATVRAVETGRLRLALGAGLAAGVLAWVHTYDLVIVAGALGAWGVANGAAGRIPFSALARAALVVAAAAAPFVAWQVYVVLTDPSVAQMGQLQPVGSPVAVLTGLGGLAVLAAVGVPAALRRGPVAGVVVAWAVVVPLLLVLPVPFPRRMVAGWHVPLGLLAGIGLVALLRPIRQRALRAGAVSLAVGLLCITTADLLVYQTRHFASGGRAAGALPREVIEAFAWLDEQARPGENVLAPYGFSNWLPVFTDLRPYFGHWAETPDAMGRYQEVLRFYGRGTPAARRVLLQRERIRFVLFGSLSGGSGFRVPNPESLGLRRVHRVGSLEIYEVTSYRSSPPTR